MHAWGGWGHKWVTRPACICPYIPANVCIIRHRHISRHHISHASACIIRHHHISHAPIRHNHISHACTCIIRHHHISHGHHQASSHQSCMHMHHQASSYQSRMSSGIITSVTHAHEHFGGQLWVTRPAHTNASIYVHNTQSSIGTHTHGCSGQPICMHKQTAQGRTCRAMK